MFKWCCNHSQVPVKTGTAHLCMEIQLLCSEIILVSVRIGTNVFSRSLISHTGKYQQNKPRNSSTVWTACCQVPCAFCEVWVRPPWQHSPLRIKPCVNILSLVISLLMCKSIFLLPSVRCHPILVEGELTNQKPI